MYALGCSCGYAHSAIVPYIKVHVHKCYICVQEIVHTLSARITVSYPSFISKYLAKVQGA
jgi:hypothetical protein